MLIIISPAKSLNFEDKNEVERRLFPIFSKESNILAQILRKYKSEDLELLMNISPKLAELNFQRYQKWKENPDIALTKEAVFAFQGDVYQGLNINSYNTNDLDYTQIHLRILSGLYGILRPLDQIQPYRLEMGINLKSRRGNHLYAFWGESITKEINKHLKNQNFKFLINLASKEYSKIINFNKIKAQIITPNFKEFRNGELKFISFNAKRARGFLSRYILKKRIQNPEEIKLFNTEGYYFDVENSTKNDWLFVR